MASIALYPTQPPPVSVDTALIGTAPNGDTVNTTAGEIAALAPVGPTFPPLASAPPDPTVGQAYFDLTLGYPLIYCADMTWHGFQLS